MKIGSSMRHHRWSTAPRHQPSRTSVARRRTQPPARALDRGLLRSRRPSRACSASCARWSARTSSASRADQRVHGRDPDPEPRSRAGRRRRALGCVRARLQRAARARREAARLAGRLDALLAHAARASSGVTALFILLAPLLMRPFGDPGGDFDLAVGLSRVLFPIVVLLGLSGIVVGILNTYHHFALPALAPVAWNLVIVLGLLLGVPRIDDESAAALPLRRRRRARHAGHAAPADPVAAEARRPPHDGRSTGATRQ